MRLPLDANPTPDDLLGIYLNDHLAGASTGVELCRRSARGQRDPHRQAELSRISHEVAEDRDSLLALMKTLGVSVKKHRIVAGWAAEKVGRLKPNGTWVRRSPLSDVLELEFIRLGVEGKLCLWRVLQRLAGTDPRVPTDTLATLERRGIAQVEALEAMRLEAADALRA